MYKISPDGLLSLYRTKTCLFFLASPGVGSGGGGRELSLSACPGWGIDRQGTKKLQILGDMPRADGNSWN